MMTTPSNPSMQWTREGKVSLVGGGPGAAELITVRGARLLAQADLVLYDYLANPELLSSVHEGCELICLGKHGESRVWSQTEINEKMVLEARRGRHVVRLKGGDPSVFGRGAEETDWLARHSVPFEVVPGVTAASAVTAFTGVPLTHRQSSSAVALVTGQGSTDPDGKSLDFRGLATFPGTIVVYMGVTSARQWVGQLIEGGLAPETSAVLVRRCSLPDQQVVHCVLEEIPAAIEEHHLRPPVLACVGNAVRNRSTVCWFEGRPLFGRRIMVTRPIEQVEDLARPLRELGAHVLVQPAIRIGPPPDWTPVDRQLARLQEWDWLVFSSANGVRYFLERLRSIGRDSRALGCARFAVTGPGTRKALDSFGFRADLEPTSFVAEELVDAVAPHVSGQRVLLVRASRGRELLAERLRPIAANLEQVVAYQSQDVTTAHPEIANALEHGDMHWVTVTSSAIAASLVRLFGDSLRRAKLASISPITSATLRDLSHEPTIEAGEQTMSGIVRAIIEYERRS